MTSTVKFLLGEAGSGKTGRLLAEYRSALRQHRQRRRPGQALWLAPTHRVVQAVVEKLLDANEPTQFAPRVMTFDSFAEQILDAAGRPATPISSVSKRLLLRRIVDELRQAGMLTSFAPVAHTSGFLDVVSAFISELKREEIWPEAFLSACSHRPPKLARRDGELGLVYEHYQKQLGIQNGYDNEGRFWLARNALSDGVRGPFAHVEFLAVDGFADFTQTQYEILGHLVGWIETTTITLPYQELLPDSDTAVVQIATRPELFTKPRAALESIRRHLPSGAVCKVTNLAADRSQTPVGLRTVAQQLFSNPRSVTQFGNAAGLEVIAATGPEGERQSIARRIKTLLQNGVAPSQIIVATRTVSDSGNLWKDYFEEAGIPTWCEAGTPLNTSPIVKALFSILQLELEDWPFLRLMQVLDSNYFRPQWHVQSSGKGPRAVSAALRALKLHAGRELMLRVLARVGSSVSSASTNFDDAVSLADADQRALSPLARTAERVLLQLSRTTERLRHRHTLTDWGDVISSLGEDLGWRQAEGERGTEISKVDIRDWDLVQRIIRTAGEADRMYFASESDVARKQPRLNLDEFVAELRDLLRTEQIKPGADPGGCVRILDVEQARHLDFPHLFLVGLSESTFPRNRSDDCLFGETERQEFAQRGLNLKHREQNQRDEMFLFYSIVTRAKSQLTLSYPAVNSKGQPVFPSPYVAAIRSLFTSDGLAASIEGQLDPVPSSDCVLTEADLRLSAIGEARANHAGLFTRLCERSEWIATGQNILAAIDVNANRFHQRGFTSYEGRLTSHANLAGLQQRFGPRHQFSATELEGYATCPFRFWMQSVLNIDELGTPEHGTDYAARGSLIHAVLAQLLREGMEASAADLAARFDQLVEGHLAQRFHETDLQRAMTRIERRLLAEWGRAFADQQVDYFNRLRQVWSKRIEPLPPEIPFGSLPDATKMSDEPVHPSLAFGDGVQAVRVRGRIDRVDTGFCQGHRVFNVIDYKTGQAPKSSDAELKSGRAMQLALYSLAVQRLGLAGPNSTPFCMGYWNLKSSGFVRGYQRNTEEYVPLPAEQFDTLEEILDQVIPQLAMGIRSGKFIVENEDDDCTGRCPYRTTCRVNQIRPLTVSLNKVGDILQAASHLSPH